MITALDQKGDTHSTVQYSAEINTNHSVFAITHTYIMFFYILVFTYDYTFVNLEETFTSGNT